MTAPSETTSPTLDAIDGGVKTKVTGALVLLGVLMAVGLGGSLWFAEAERQRDIRIVQARMRVIADSRAEAVHAWIQARFDELGDLARNESLQVYTRVLGPRDDGRVFDDDPALRAYLRTLLTATAQRAGFRPAVPAHDLPANVTPGGGAGLALVTPDGTGIVASPDMPPIDGALRAFLHRVPVADRGLSPPYRAADGTPVLAFAVPVLARGADGGGRQVIARVVGLRPFGAEVAAALRQPGDTSASAHTALVRAAGDRVQVLTTTAEDGAILDGSRALGTPGLVTAAAVAEPGGFVEGVTHAGTPVFAVSRAIPETDWVLVHALDRAEVLAASATRRATLLTVLVLVVLGMGAGVVAVWRHATSVRVREAAERYRASSARFQAMSRFLDVVTDTQPHALFVTDANQTLTFVNRRAAEVMGAPKADLTGRALVAMLGQDRGHVYAELARDVLTSGQDRTHTAQFDDGEGGGEPVVWRSTSCRLNGMDGRAPEVLTAIEDRTALVRERRRRERNTQQLIETLVGLVDERDPDSAHQSRHVTLVARTIAEEMGLDAPLVAATDQAARLVNIGKIRVPRALLTRRGALSDAELRQVREALDSGPDILRELEFDGPVIETLRQINERVDGGGRPLGLSGADILPSAQAVALANTFVALIRPRAFRAGKSFDEAERILMGEIDRRFDRRPVLSLLNTLNNKGGRDAWAELARPDSEHLIPTVIENDRCSP
ncbi:HD domain-containing phosphohydrolase [Roseospira visakhapatnamensis]|uniref:PAS domain S-box-containing protein n=1 Tax=Roseospira visakhapatnamensis TaxID=390880 RepID=A0A7W6W8G7_9PROT|nr:HD domain-containing phosphohydrolase [Roseospira visakhapatnamensis]MBB4264813.1 PAS domain S-box-containing protein [Roseospira visakhapatnamensis]